MSRRGRERPDAFLMYVREKVLDGDVEALDGWLRQYVADFAFRCMHRGRMTPTCRACHVPTAALNSTPLKLRLLTKQTELATLVGDAQACRTWTWWLTCARISPRERAIRSTR